MNSSEVSSPASPSTDSINSGSESDDDLEFHQGIQSCFSLSSEDPQCALPSDISDDDLDGSETLGAVQRRFSAFANCNSNIKKPEHEQLHSTNDCDNLETQQPCCIEKLPKSAQRFIDAIKKNRSYQKFLRRKLTHIEAKIEENNKLRKRVKILKGFQVSCKKSTGRALSQWKDLRVRLISTKDSKVNNDDEDDDDDKKVSAMHYGPEENSHVANYKMALTRFAVTNLRRKKWSEAEKENLGKGIKQQFQENVLQVSMDRFEDTITCLDNILESIKDLDITPEKIREFIPKVNWDQLASTYVVGRSGAECESQWLNCEDSLINRNPWTAEEEKKLLSVIEEKGIGNWFDIAVSLGTYRTPFQCLARYQRSLNASILKREWTREEDDQLRNAVEVIGESDWQYVASTLKGRTGNQCSNRWLKSLHPTRKRVGRWTLDEDKHLKVAVMLFGAKNWNMIAKFVQGRTQVQCRERWVNSLDPSLKFGEWTEEEDSRLKAAVSKHGYCWSKVATCMPSRTDNQCWRRWKSLFPDEVPLRQAARRIKKAALVCNFVDRQSERPALDPNGFMIGAVENVNSPKKRKRNSKGSPESENENDGKACNVPRNNRSKRPRKEAQV